MIPAIIKFFQGGGSVNTETNPTIAGIDQSRKDRRRNRRDGIRFMKASPEEQASGAGYSGKYKTGDDAKKAYANGERDRYAIMSQLQSFFDTKDPVTVYSRATKNSDVVNGKTNTTFTSSNYMEQNGRAAGWQHNTVNGHTSSEYGDDLPDGSRYHGNDKNQGRYETPEEASKNR